MNLINQATIYQEKNGTAYTHILSLNIPLTIDNIEEMKKGEIDINDLKTIIKYGFFGFSHGSITMHRDDSGKIRRIEKEIVYSKQDNEKIIEKHIFYINP